MAIQIPDAGTGNGATGDNEFVLWSKVINNFSDQTNAASRLVGTGAEQIPQNKHLGTAAIKNVGTGSEQIPLAQDALKAALGRAPATYSSSSPAADLNIDILTGGDIRAVQRSTAVGAPPQLTNNYISVLTMRIGAVEGGNSRFQFAWGQNTTGFVWRTSNYIGLWDVWEKPYTDKNTTKDANGFLKGASPVIDMYDNKIDLNNDAEQQGGITFEKLGIGDYLIKGSLGFAQEGWYIETPKDANGNVLVAVVYEQLANNDLSIKTYAKRFDDETGDIVANLAKPRDIPNGRFISLRLHELPKEPTSMPTETQMEV